MHTAAELCILRKKGTKLWPKIELTYLGSLKILQAYFFISVFKLFDESITT